MPSSANNSNSSSKPAPQSGAAYPNLSVGGRAELIQTSLNRLENLENLDIP